MTYAGTVLQVVVGTGNVSLPGGEPLNITLPKTMFQIGYPDGTVMPLALLNDIVLRLPYQGAAMANLAMWVTATGECYTCYRNDDIEQVAWTDYVTAVTTTPRL